MFSHSSVDLWSQDKVQPGLVYPSGLSPGKVRLNYASERSQVAKRFRAELGLDRCWLFPAFPRIYPLSFSSFLVVPNLPSFSLHKFVPCNATWKPASYLSDPKQIFHGSIQSNLTQWVHEIELRVHYDGATHSIDRHDSTRKLRETELSTSPR